MKPKSPADKLEILGQRLTKAKKGFRRTKYDIYEETMEQVIEMRSDPAALEDFVKRAGINSKKLKSSNASWIAPAAFTFVTHNEQQGWKGARAAEFLHDFMKVPIGELAEQMRKLGGIEKIVNLAAKEDPRQLKDPGGTKKGGKAGLGKGPRRPLKAASAGEYISGEDSNDEPDDKPDSSTLEEGTMVVGINADLSAELEQIAVGEPVKLIGTRAGDWGEPILFQVEKVIAVVKKHKLRWGKPWTVQSVVLQGRLQIFRRHFERRLCWSVWKLIRRPPSG
jgi:hypothetical protein